jgi:L-alanine-DL-glutamate epimerase-like enolase superfamily enzyme
VKLEVFVERFTLAQVFAISRGRKTEAMVVRAVLSAGGVAGQGECVPYARYGETVDGVVAAIAAQAGLFAGGVPTHEALAAAMPPGAARNALDCALWDFRARRDGPSVAEAIGLALPETILTCVTLSLDTPEAMARAARKTAAPLLKLKLGGDGDAARMRQVRAARPEARLVVDANEGWAERDLAKLLAVAAECGVELVEQPLPAGDDGALADIVRPVPVCADESAHGIGDLDRLAARYDAINVKLDKAGGLTGALALTRAARERGFRIMIGSMVGTSLSMLPAAHLAGLADWVDLDGPFLLAEDRAGGMVVRGPGVLGVQAGFWR